MFLPAIKGRAVVIILEVKVKPLVRTVYHVYTCVYIYNVHTYVYDVCICIYIYIEVCVYSTSDDIGKNKKDQWSLRASYQSLLSCKGNAMSCFHDFSMQLFLPIFSAQSCRSCSLFLALAPFCPGKI